MVAFFYLKDLLSAKFLSFQSKSPSSLMKLGLLKEININFIILIIIWQGLYQLIIVEGFQAILLLELKIQHFHDHQ